MEAQTNATSSTIEDSTSVPGAGSRIYMRALTAARDAFLQELYSPARNAALLLCGRLPAQSKESLSPCSALPRDSGASEHLACLVVQGSIAALAYATWGRAAGGLLRMAARSRALEGLAARVAGSELSGQVAGAALHDFCLDAENNRNRAAHVFSGVAAIGTYEVCNRYAAARSPLVRMLALAPTGAAGGAVGYLSGQIVERQPIDFKSLAASSLDGACLNIFLPTAQAGSTRMLDLVNVAIGRGVPLEREMNYRRLHGKSETLDRLFENYPLLRVQPTASDFASLNHRKSLITLPAGRENSQLLTHELAHREAYRIYEGHFKLAQALLGDHKSQARKIFVEARLLQENHARKRELQVEHEFHSPEHLGGKKPGGKLFPDRLEGSAWQSEYLKCFAREFELFRQHHGQWRPEFDFGHLGGRGIDLNQLAGRDEPHEIVATLYEVLAKPQQEALAGSLKRWKDIAPEKRSAFDLIYGLEPRALRQAFSWTALHDCVTARFCAEKLPDGKQQPLSGSVAFSECSKRLDVEQKKLDEALIAERHVVDQARLTYVHDMASRLEHLLKIHSLLDQRLNEILAQISLKQKQQSEILLQEYELAASRIEGSTPTGRTARRARMLKEEALACNREAEKAALKTILRTAELAGAGTGHTYLERLSVLNESYAQAISEYAGERRLRLEEEERRYLTEIGPLGSLREKIAEEDLLGASCQPGLSDCYTLAVSPFLEAHESALDTIESRFKWSISTFARDRQIELDKLSCQEHLNSYLNDLLAHRERQDEQCRQLEHTRALFGARANRIRAAYQASMNSPQLRSVAEQLADCRRSFKTSLSKCLDSAQAETQKQLSESCKWLQPRVRSFQDFQCQAACDRARVIEAAAEHRRNLHRSVACNVRRLCEELVEQSAPKELVLTYYPARLSDAALSTALTFGSRSSLWLSNRIKAAVLGGEKSDLIIPISPEVKDARLSQLLLSNSFRNAEELTHVCQHWSTMLATGQNPLQKSFSQLLELATSLSCFPGARVPDLALEAARGRRIGRDSYFAAEKDYLESLSVPEPFPTDVIFQQERYVARFLPRSDFRRLFMGNHTNSCMRIGAANESGIRWVQKSPLAGVFVVENSKNQDVIAASRVWTDRDAKQVCFNSIQSKGTAGHDLQIISLYRAAADYLVNSRGARLVTVGTDHSKVDLSSLPPALTLVPLPHDIEGLFDCDRQQVLLCLHPARRELQ